MKNKIDEKDPIFPAETSLLISEILEKYELDDTTEEVRKKFLTKEKSVRFMIAILIRKMAMNDIAFNEMARAIEKDLSMPPEKAILIATELKNKVVSLAKDKKSFEEQEKIKVAQNKQTNSTPASSPKGPNPYREPLE